MEKRKGQSAAHGFGLDLHDFCGKFGLGPVSGGITIRRRRIYGNYVRRRFRPDRLYGSVFCGRMDVCGFRGRDFVFGRTSLQGGKTDRRKGESERHPDLAVCFRALSAVCVHAEGCIGRV